jgi:hypothetical protein
VFNRERYLLLMMVWFFCFSCSALTHLNICVLCWYLSCVADTLLRLNSYHLQGKEYRHKENIICNILHNNSYPIVPQKPNNNHGSQSQNSQNNQKCCTFTYTGKETMYTTKIFKHWNIKVAYRTNNTLQKHLTHSIQNHGKFTRFGVYKLTCADCEKAYIRQTGRDF